MTADFHNDVLTAQKKRELLEDYSSSGNTVVCAYYKGSRTFADAYSACKDFCEKGYEKMYLAFEDFSYSTELTALDALLSFSPVYVTLTWNDSNALGGGALSVSGLTALGEAVINLLNERKISLDLAHANEKTFFRAEELSLSPVCSHTCFYDVCPHPRNLKREQIRAIVERKGIIGLAFYPPFLKADGVACVEDIIRHVDYYCERFSPEYLAIGSDINGCESYIDGFSDYGFEPILKEALEKRGYPRKIIQGILSDNLKRFLGDKRRSPIIYNKESGYGSQNNLR